MTNASHYPPIDDYAFISDCHCAALISRGGSIDWLCMPRLDAGSYFARLLDHERGGHCAITPGEGGRVAYRRYLDRSLVLETTLENGAGAARLIDCLVLREGGRDDPPHEVIRVVEGVRGRVDLDFHCAPRFDYGEVSPWIRQQGPNCYCAMGGDDGLLITSDTDIAPTGRHALGAAFTVRPGQRVHFSLRFVPPAELDAKAPSARSAEEIDDRLDETLRLWRQWASRAMRVHDPAVLRSALVLRGLVHAPTGAIAAAATTSLPEAPGGQMNWDYRYCWVRDAFFSVNALARIGFDAEAEGFRRFVERTSAGSAREVKVIFGVGGERRLTELELGLAGYRDARPVRVGNAAAGQFQLDMYGELLELTWQWHRRGHSPDDDYWRFLVDLVDTAAERWGEPDHGLWEARGEPQHFVRSKAMCWTALDRGIRLAQQTMRRAPTQRWQRVRDEIREAVEERGYDGERGVFTRTFDSSELDSVLLLLPRAGFIAYDDERMIRTTDAIREELDDNGLLRRFATGAPEGAFLACSFWLVECLAHQGRMSDAREVFDRAVAAGNDLGLFAEEYDTRNATLLGNFPQALTHLSHIAAAVCLRECEPPRPSASI